MKRRLLLFIAAILLVLPGCNNSNWSSGDRVLVAKFLYEAEVADPRRFEVVVFKYPRGPLEKNVPKNYIKRLMGLPGEILAIFFGRIFRVPAPEPGQPPYFDDVANKEIDPKDLWQSNYMHINENTGNDQEGKGRAERFDQGSFGKFEIVRKSPDVMMALRRIVYDNDFPAKDLVGPKWQRWLPAKASGWIDNKDNSFAHQGATKEAVDWLRYRHILRPMESHEPLPDGRPPELITDFMGYNSFFEQDFQGHEWRRLPDPNWVGDLMLECNLTVAKAEGEFVMELSKGINRFQARWDLGSGMCTLTKIGQDRKKADLDAKPTRVKSPGSYLVRFANIDARLTVWVDRDLPFENGHNYPPPEIRGPGDAHLDEAALEARRGPTENDLQPASLGSKGAAVSVHNLKLWRDTYYTQNASQPGCDIVPPLTPLAPADWSDPSKWDVFKHMPYKTMYVQPGHYLCLGDNSQQSSDSRDWGLVPHRLMLGRALLVYYPFNRAGAIR